jgi:hypothetical protein
MKYPALRKAGPAAITTARTGAASAGFISATESLVRAASTSGTLENDCRVPI